MNPDYPVFKMKCVEQDLNAALYSKIYDFYEDNRHSFNAERDPTELLDALQRGSAVYIEDDKGEIVAASLTFRYNDEVTETGATRVTFNGFKLQQRLKWYQLIDDYLFRWPTRMYISVIATGNDSSKWNIEQCGFEELPTTTTLFNELGLSDENLNEFPKSIYRFNENNLADIATNLSDLFNNPVITNKRNETIILQVEGHLNRNTGLKGIVAKLANS